jgi:hypothetical protein
VPGRDPGQPRVGAAPGVVEQVRAGLRDHLGDLGAPGVDADHHVRVALAHRRDQARDPVDLGGGGHLVTGSRLDPADVHDLGPVGHRPAGRVQRRTELPGGPAVEEGIRGPVHDGHDPERSGRPRPDPEPERPRVPVMDRAGPGVCHRTEAIALAVFGKNR